MNNLICPRDCRSLSIHCTLSRERCIHLQGEKCKNRMTVNGMCIYRSSLVCEKFGKLLLMKNSDLQKLPECVNQGDDND